MYLETNVYDAYVLSHLSHSYECNYYELIEGYGGINLLSAEPW